MLYVTKIFLSKKHEYKSPAVVFVYLNKQKFKNKNKINDFDICIKNCARLCYTKKHLSFIFISKTTKADVP